MKYDLSNGLDLNRAKAVLKKYFEEKRTIDVKLVQPNRSLKANSYLHVCLSLFGIHIGLSLEEVKEFFKKNMYLTYEKDIGGELMTFNISTSKYTTEQMSELINLIRDTAEGIGFYIPTSEEYKRERNRIDNEIEMNNKYLKA